MAVVVSVGMRSSLASAGGIFDAPALAVEEKDLRSRTGRYNLGFFVDDRLGLYISCTMVLYPGCTAAYTHTEHEARVW